MYENAIYMSHEAGKIDNIKVDIFGVTCLVPLDANNTDYGRIQELVASGELVIADAVPPVEAPKP